MAALAAFEHREEELLFVTVRRLDEDGYLWPRRAPVRIPREHMLASTSTGWCEIYDQSLRITKFASRAQWATIIDEGEPEIAVVWRTSFAMILRK